jgi:hypothetical protein
MYLLLNATYMSKKVIRLTESELKRMIKNIISEQPVPGAAAPAQGIKKEVLSQIRNQNADLFADAGKATRLGRYKIMQIGTSQDGKPNNMIMLEVKNLNEISNTGGEQYGAKDPKSIKSIQMSCDGLYLYAQTNDGKGMRVYCPGLEAKLKEALNCQMIDRGEGFTSTGGSSAGASFT